MPSAHTSPKERLPDYAAIRAAELEPWRAHLHGNRFASVLAIKGEPGPAERAGKPPFFGEDAQALESAFVTMGFESGSWCGIALELPEKESIDALELRLLIETIDPQALVALDHCAILLLQEAYGVELMPVIPEPGKKSRILGRALVYVEGFEAALASNDGGEAKKRVWNELKALNLN